MSKFVNLLLFVFFNLLFLNNSMAGPSGIGGKVMKGASDSFNLDYDRLARASSWLTSDETIRKFGLSSVARLPDVELVRTFAGKNLMVLLGKNRNNSNDIFIEVGQHLGKVQELSAFENILGASIDGLNSASLQLSQTARQFGIELENTVSVAIYKTGVKTTKHGPSKVGTLAAASRYRIVNSVPKSDMDRFLKEIHELVETNDGLLGL